MLQVEIKAIIGRIFGEWLSQIDKDAQHLENASKVTAGVDLEQIAFNPPKNCLTRIFNIERHISWVDDNISLACRPINY